MNCVTFFPTTDWMYLCIIRICKSFQYTGRSSRARGGWSVNWNVSIPFNIWFQQKMCVKILSWIRDTCRICIPTCTAFNALFRSLSQHLGLLMINPVCNPGPIQWTGHSFFLFPLIQENSRYSTLYTSEVDERYLNVTTSHTLLWKISTIRFIRLVKQP